jgi:methylated-DNA-protein-cysteine methyltransferase-like protein
LKVLKNQDFFTDVYDVVRLVPKGRVTSYGAIANYLGAKQGARMVGWAMNASHKHLDIPAHRVVNRKGLLSGQHHFETPTQMQTLLEEEGILVKNHQIQDFEKVFWDPSFELGLP